MAYGSVLTDVVQGSTAGTPPQFNDGNGTQIGTLCRAWVQFAGASGTIAGSFNVSSVTRNSAGYYTVNFSTALADINYSATVQTSTASDTTFTKPLVFTNSSFTPTAPTTSNFVFFCVNLSAAAKDPNYANVAVFR